MFARLRFLPNAFSITPEQLRESVSRDLEWLAYARQYANNPMWRNQFAYVSQRVMENARMLTPYEMNQIIEQAPVVPGITNALRQ
jgi:hypothetical protein